MNVASAFRWVGIAMLMALPCCAVGDDAQQQHRTVQRKATGPPPPPPPVRDPEHTFQLRVRSYTALKRQNIVMQRRDYSCGAACVATICRYYWEDNVTEDMVLRTLDEILTREEIIERIRNGLAMSDLRRAAVKLGYQATVGKLTFAKLTESKVPVIVGISPEGYDHFVVYRGSFDDWVYVADPTRGNLRMTVRDFTSQWQENAILVIHKPGREVRKWSSLSVRPGEISLGELNDQLILTQPQRQPPLPQFRLVQ